MTQQDKKPLLLSAALMLSIAGSSIACVTFFTAAAFFDQTQRLIGELTNIQTPQKASSLAFVIMGALFALSLAGALKMNRMQKSGFYFYLTAQLALLLAPFAWAGPQAFSSTNTIFTLLFLSIYARFLRKLN